jgi:putative redox protein
MTATIVYEGELRCTCTHLQSGSIIETDAPTDNHGKGERFSPTDTVCIALGTCIITTMGIKAQTMDIELKGTTLQVTKHMISSPRRIGKIEVNLEIPGNGISDSDRIILQRTGDLCPVKASLHPDLETIIKYNWI